MIRHRWYRGWIRSVISSDILNLYILIIICGFLISPSRLLGYMNFTKTHCLEIIKEKAVNLHQ